MTEVEISIPTYWWRKSRRIGVKFVRFTFTSILSHFSTVEFPFHISYQPSFVLLSRYITLDFISISYQMRHSYRRSPEEESQKEIGRQEEKQVTDHTNCLMILLLQPAIPIRFDLFHENTQIANIAGNVEVENITKGKRRVKPHPAPDINQVLQT